MKAVLKVYWPQLSAAVANLKNDPTVPADVIAAGDVFYAALKKWMES
jgi:hypothetical protein